MILDAGVLVSIAWRERTAIEFLAALRRREIGVTTTQPVVAQVHRSPRQVQLDRFLKMGVDHLFDFDDGRRVGELLAASGTGDVVDAHLVLVAVQREEPIVTCDVSDIEHLLASNDLDIDVIPWP